MEPTQKLIYDRSFKDVQRVAELNRKISAGSASAEEVQEWFSAKGALNYEDLNRIESWTEFLSNQLKSYGYNAPITKRAERTYTYYEKPEPGDEPSEPVSRLPEGYRELTYIESTGTQYVDTGIVLNATTYKTFKLSMDAQILDSGTALNGIAVGSTNQMSIGTLSGAIYYGNGTGAVNTSVQYDYTRRQWIYDAVNLKASVSGLLDLSFTLNAVTVAKNFLLFGFSNSTGQTCHKQRHWGSKIWENDTLVRDFIPCRNPSGDVGLYDLVTKQFFGNAGTGVFKQGEAVVSLPEGYERAQYIEATGTQYINTGIQPNNDTRVIMDYLNTGDYSNNSSSVTMLFGARTGSASAAYVIWLSNSAVYPNFGNKGYSANGSITTDISKRFTVDMNGNVLSVNGTELVCTDSTFTTPYNLLLLAFSAKEVVTQWNTAGKIYACQIYDKGAIARDYIPCKYNGVFGLYDLIEGKFYGNAGTGVFLGTAKRKLPEGYTQVDYIESSGTQYIDTLYRQTSEKQRIVADFVYTQKIQATSPFGCQNNSAGTRCIIPFGESTSSVSLFVGSGQGIIKKTVALNTRYVFDITANNGTATFALNGDVGTATYSGATTKDLNYTLFANNVNGTAQQFATIRLYATQIYDNSTLVRDYVPCVNAQGTAGLYDLAIGAFYANAGSGTFATGEVVEYIENVGGGSNGPTAITVTYTDWRVWDVPHLAEIKRIRDNVNGLRDGFYSLSDWREIAYKNNPNFEDVNTLEWDMQTIYNWLKLMVLNFKYSGEAYAGEAW